MLIPAFASIREWRQVTLPINQPRWVICEGERTEYDQYLGAKNQTAGVNVPVCMFLLSSWRFQAFSEFTYVQAGRQPWGQWESQGDLLLTQLSYMYFAWDCVLDTAVCDPCVSLLVSWSVRNSNVGVRVVSFPLSSLPFPCLIPPRSLSTPTPTPPIFIPYHCVNVHKGHSYVISLAWHVYTHVHVRVYYMSIYTH